MRAKEGVFQFHCLAPFLQTQHGTSVNFFSSFSPTVKGGSPKPGSKLCNLEPWKSMRTVVQMVIKVPVSQGTH